MKEKRTETKVTVLHNIWDYLEYNSFKTIAFELDAHVISTLHTWLDQ